MEINVLWLLQNHLSLSLAHFGEKLLLAEIDFNLPIGERTNGPMHGTLKCARTAGTSNVIPLWKREAQSKNWKVSRNNRAIDPRIDSLTNCFPLVNNNFHKSRFSAMHANELIQLITSSFVIGQANSICGRNSRWASWEVKRKRHREISGGSMAGLKTWSRGGCVLGFTGLGSWIKNENLNFNVWIWAVLAGSRLLTSRSWIPR